MRGVTLQQLALATGRSVGYLSQVEHSLTGPSVAALQDIKDALAVHIGWFFPEDAAGSVEEREHIVRKLNRRRLTTFPSQATCSIAMPILPSAEILWWSGLTRRLPCVSNPGK